MAERPYSFLKGSEAAGVGLLRPLPAGGTAPAVLRCPPALGAPPWTPQMCQGRGGTRGPSLAAGPQPGPPPSPALGGGILLLFPVCFVGGAFLFIWVFQGGLGRLYIYFFFCCCCCFISKRTTACVGQGGVRRQGMPCRGGYGSLPALPALLLDEEGGGTGMDVRMHWLRWRHSCQPGQGEGWARAQAREHFSLFILFLLFFPSPLTHTHKRPSVFQSPPEPSSWMQRVLPSGCLLLKSSVERKGALLLACGFFKLFFLNYFYYCYF